MKFITHRPLWVNIIVGILLALGIFAVILLSLNLITGHGKAGTVPSVTGKNYEEEAKILKKAGFDVEIQDSVYVDTMKPLTVIKQLPDADEVVKSNRTVFLIISRAIPPLVEMPNLLGYSYRNLKRYPESFKAYETALDIDPKHRGAHEYIGVAYIQTGNLAKAEEHLAALDKICFFPCEEFTDLKKAVAAAKAKAN